MPNPGEKGEDVGGSWRIQEERPSHNTNPASFRRRRLTPRQQHPPLAKQAQPLRLTQRKRLLEIPVLEMEPAQRAQRLGQIEIRQGLEDVEDERGIAVTERQVLARRDQDADIEALLFEHALHVAEGLQLGVLRVDDGGEVLAVGEEFHDCGAAAVDELVVGV